MVVAAVEAPAVIGLYFLHGHACILDIQKGTLAVQGKVHTCQAMRDMPAIFRISMTETASTGASQTFSASVSGLNAAEDGGICCMKVKSLRIEGSSPSGWYKWTGSRVQAPPDGMNEQDRGFESLRMVWMNRIEGSSPSGWYEWTGSRVRVPPDGINSRVQVPQVKGLSPSLLYECNNSSRVKSEVWNAAFS